MRIRIGSRIQNKNKRHLYFVAACSLFDSDLELPVALKLRPHGGLIGIDDSKLDPFLKHSKFLRLHAVLHDAAGFIKDYSNKGPGYVYAISSCGINSCFLGHLSGILFCLYLKWFKSYSFNLLEC